MDTFGSNGSGFGSSGDSSGNVSVSSDLSLAPKTLQRTGTSYGNKLSRKFGTKTATPRVASLTLSSARKTGPRKQGFKSAV